MGGWLSVICFALCIVHSYHAEYKSDAYVRYTYTGIYSLFPHAQVWYLDRCSGFNLISTSQNENPESQMSVPCDGARNPTFYGQRKNIRKTKEQEMITAIVDLVQYGRSIMKWFAKYMYSNFCIHLLRGEIWKENKNQVNREKGI